MAPAPQKKKMVTTRSNQKVTSLAETTSEESTSTASRPDSSFTLAGSRLPQKPTSNQSSPIYSRPSHISDQPTSLSIIDEISKQPASPYGHLNAGGHDTSDLREPPSTIYEFSPNPMNPSKEEKMVPESTPLTHQNQPYVKPAIPSTPEPTPQPQLGPEIEPGPEQQQLQHELEARAEAKEGPTVERARSGTGPLQTSGSLRSLISWSRHSLAVDEERLAEMHEPESDNVMSARRAMDGLHGRYELARREQDREFRNNKAELRVRKRDLDQAERELEELFHHR